MNTKLQKLINRIIIFFLLFLSISISITPTASAGKVWVDGNLVYDSDTHPSFFDSLRMQLATIAGGVSYQTYVGISRAFFGGGSTDDCTWTAENYRVAFPTYYNQYPIQCGAGKGYFFAQFRKDNGKESGQITATSEEALFDWMDSVGIDYSSFYTRPVVSTPTPTPTPTPQPIYTPVITPLPSPTPPPVINEDEPTPLPVVTPVDDYEEENKNTNIDLYIGIAAVLVVGLFLVFSPKNKRGRKNESQH